MKLGLTVVVLALMGAILAGSIAFNPTPTLETEYERVTDLAPIVSASPVDSSELYNPNSNQTGWTDVNYVLQDDPSIFSIVVNGSIESWTSPMTFTEYGGIYYTKTAGTTGGGSSSIKWSDGSNGMIATTHMIGGYSGEQTTYSTSGTYKAKWTVSYDNTVATNNTPVYWQNLTDVATIYSWPAVIITASEYIHPADFQFTSSGNKEKYATLHAESLDYTVGDKYMWDGSRSGWYLILGTDPYNNPVLSDSPTDIIWYDPSGTSYVNEEVYTAGSRIYITPYSPVGIDSGTTASWTNGYANVRVQLLADPTVTVTASDGSQTITINLPNEAQAYDKVLITIGAASNDRYWQGVKNYVSPTNYSLLEYRYTIPGGAAIDSINTLTVSGSSMAYIANTWVPSDPAALLWQDPIMAPETFFPEVMSNGARVIFSSILVTGDSLTINNESYSTSDKKIQIDGRWYGLNGFSVDYQNGNTYLNTPTGERFDLGETVSTVISGSGVWYWSAELDSINITTGERTDVLFGQSPSAEWSVFAFIGLIGLCFLGCIALGRESLDGYDWIIMILASIIALMLVM